MMKRIVTNLHLGAEEPFSLLHICDVHLTRTDEHDCEALRTLAQKRIRTYPDSESSLDEITALHKQTGYPVLATGDLMDFCTPQNLARVAKFTSEVDCIACPGNHDFRPLGGMQYDVPESRALNGKRVEEAFRNPLYFSSRILHGINIVTLDNVYYRFEKRQLDLLKAQVAKGLPILLCLHVPLYHPICFDAVVHEKRAHASLVAVPEEKMGAYPQNRFDQQIADDITREVYHYICNTPCIKAVLCGHVHKDIEAVLCDRLPQFVTSIGTIRECRID